MRLAGGQTSKNDACGRILRANVSSVCRGEGGRKEREGEREREVRRCALLYKIIGVAKSVCAKDELRLGRLRARVCRADALPMVAGCVIFHRRQLLLREPRIPPPSFCSFDPSRFLPSRSPSSFTLRSQPLLLLLLLLLLLVDPSLSFSPILLLLRHAGLFSSLFVPWWRTFATYAADTPLDTSCTILDLLISRPECTDAHTGMRSGAAHRLACAHARTRYTKGSSPFREMIFNNRPTGKCEKVQCVHLVSR